MLQELVRIVRMLAEHVVALEQRSPTWDALPPDVVTQLERLEQRLAATQADERTALTELLARIEALEARVRPAGLAACNALRKARGQSLREAIADILWQAPCSTGPDVLARLRETHLQLLPSLRTVRWHLRALRGNGNASVLPPPA